MPVLCLSTTFWTGLLFFIMSLKCCLTVSSIPSLLVFHRWDGKASQMPVTSVVVKELQTETSKEIRSRLNLSLRCSFPVNSPLPTVKQNQGRFWATQNAMQYAIHNCDVIYAEARLCTSACKRGVSHFTCGIVYRENEWVNLQQPTYGRPSRRAPLHHTETLSRHYAQPFVNEPFHVQMMRLGFLLIPRTPLAAWTARTQGLSGCNCLSGLIFPPVGLFLLLEAPVAGSKLWVPVCVSSVSSGSPHNTVIVK